MGEISFGTQGTGVGSFIAGSMAYHPAFPCNYKHWGDPVNLKKRQWIEGWNQTSLQCPPQKSAMRNAPFWWEKIFSMEGKGQWYMIPYWMESTLKGLYLSPLGMEEERYRRPCFIGDYKFSDFNLDNLPLAAKSSMRFGRALE